MARLDTGWFSHPKMMALGLMGMGLHAWSISYCDANLTDGFIPEGAVPRSLAGCSQALRVLVETGCWQPVPGGYRLHDFLEYNRSRAEVEAAKRQGLVRQRRHRNGRA
jgi:hypothetical protein